jgi:hypothetical protein
MASKRYLSDPAARPDWWTPYPLPPELDSLDPVPNTRFFASGPAGRTDGGLFSLGGIHPTTIAYGVIANEVIQIMNLARVEFRTPTGEPKPGPGAVDFSRVLASDTLINRPPTSCLATLRRLAGSTTSSTGSAPCSESGAQITWLSRHLGHSTLKVTTDI